MGRALTRPPMSPTLMRAASEMRHTKDLSHMLEEEHKRLTAKNAVRTGRAITPLYNAGGVHISAALHKLKENAGPTNITLIDSRYLGTVQDKRVVYEPFRHPFVLLEEASYTFAAVYKEYPPSETGQCTYPMVHFGSQEYHCPWVSRHTGPNQGHPALEIPKTRDKPVLVVTQRHRGAKAIRTLAQHRARTEQLSANRSNYVLKGLGKAPLPPIHNSSTKMPADRPRPGFCECCYEKYTHLERHVKNDSHRRLVCNADFYRSVDRVVWTLTRPLAMSQVIATGSQCQPREPPLSPAKSVISSIPARIKSIPLKNITNQMLPISPADVPVAPVRTTNKGLDVVDIGSDSPIYSSPSLKRRRSQRLVGRPRTSGKFVL